METKAISDHTDYTKYLKHDHRQNSAKWRLEEVVSITIYR